MKKDVIVDNCVKNCAKPCRLSALSLAILTITLSWSQMTWAEMGNEWGLGDFANLDTSVDEQLFTYDNHNSLPETVILRPKARRAIATTSKTTLGASAKQQAKVEKLTEFYQTVEQTNVEKIDKVEPIINQTKVEKVAEFYQPIIPKNNVEQPIPQPKMVEQSQKIEPLYAKPMCQGNWIYPNQATSTALTENNRQMPVYAQSDYGYYDNLTYAELTGNVKIHQGSQQVSADKVVMDMATGVNKAQGNVMLVDNQTTPANRQNTLNNVKSGGLITLADEITYNSNSPQANAKDVAFASVPLQAHGYAKQLDKLDDTHYKMNDVMFTTCSPTNPTWQISAKNIDVNTETGRGEAKNAILKIKNTPVLYLPYFNFPVDDRRASGFLVPQAGFSNDGGFTIKTPYYFNLAPNYDATVTPTIYTNRNPMLTGEFRYLTQNYGDGNLTMSYLPNDSQYADQDRSSVLFRHRWQSSKYPTLSANAIYQYTSDSSYVNDFQTFGGYTSQLNLPRRIQADYYNDYVTALAKFETFQTLSNHLNQTVLDKDKPYYRLPQLSLRYRLPNTWLNLDDNPLEITGVSDFAYFKRPIDDGSAPERSGGRLFNKITATYPFSRSWGYIKPSISLQHLYTQYDEATVIANNIHKDNKSQSIFVPEYSLDTGLHFMKAGSPFGNADGYQLISPRLKYVYSPYENQSEIPNFNTRLASLNLPQLFENSWFLGYDRLPDNHFLTTALNYRYMDNQGLTRLDASIGQQWYFNRPRVHLDNTNHPIDIDNSGTVLQISSQPRHDFWIDVDGSMTDKGKLGYINTQFRYLPNQRSLYHIGFIRRNENLLGQKDLSAITASAIFPINDQWRFLGALQYDNLKNHYSDILAGFTYDSCCYAFSLYGRRYVNELDDNAKPVNAIMAEISLSGVANKHHGQLSGLMADRVLGYNHLQND